MGKAATQAELDCFKPPRYGVPILKVDLSVSQRAEIIFESSTH